MLKPQGRMLCSCRGRSSSRQHGGWACGQADAGKLLTLCYVALYLKIPPLCVCVAVEARLGLAGHPPPSALPPNRVGRMSVRYHGALVFSRPYHHKPASFPSDIHRSLLSYQKKDNMPHEEARALLRDVFFYDFRDLDTVLTPGVTKASLLRCGRHCCHLFEPPERPQRHHSARYTSSPAWKLLYSN